MANIRDAVDAVIAAIMAQKDYLTAVDAKTGDGDHGLNMARGFTAAEERLAELPADAPLAEVLHEIGRAFIENVGGAAGPLYGIAFVRAGEAVGAKTRLDVASFEKLFSAGIDAIQRRGKAVRGDKTMLDTLIPIRDAFLPENAEGKSLRECLEDALEAGRAGAEYTKTIAARTCGAHRYAQHRHRGSGRDEFAHHVPCALRLSARLSEITQSIRAAL